MTDAPGVHDEYAASHIRTSCILTIVGSSLTIILGCTHLFFYYIHGVTRGRLSTRLNDIAAGCCVVQILASMARLVASAVRLEMGMTVFLCDWSASAVELLDPMAQVYMVEFFIALAFLRRFARQRQRSLLVHVAPLMFGVAAVSTLWIVLRNSRTSTGTFTAHLPWCWIPPSASEVTNVTDTQLVILRIACAFVFFIAMICAGVLALARLVCVESRNTEWTSTLKKHVVIRFAGVTVVAFFAYLLDFVNRTGLHDKYPFFLVMTGFLFPLLGAANSLAFLASEDILPILYRCDCGHEPCGLSSDLSFVGNLPLEGETPDDKLMCPTPGMSSVNFTRDIERDCPLFVSGSSKAGGGIGMDPAARRSMRSHHGTATGRSSAKHQPAAAIPREDSGLLTEEATQRSRD